MPDHFYVYPAYLEKDVPRALGRRLPSADALPEVTTEQILVAAKSLGFKAEVEAGKQYPRQVEKYAGRVKIVKKAGTTKTQALRQIARAVSETAATARGA